MEITRKHVGPRMSQIVCHGNTVYLAGQIADELSGDVADQTRQILEKIDGYLAEAGTDKRNLLSGLIHLAHVGDFKAMNEVWDAWVVEGCTPARTCVGATIVRPNILVEITIVAAR